MSTKKYTCTLQAAFLRILTAEPGCLNQAGYGPFVLFYPMFIMPGLCVPGFFLPRRGYRNGNASYRVSRIKAPSLNLLAVSWL